MFRFNGASCFDSSAYIKSQLCNVKCTQLQSIDFRCRETAANHQFPFSGSGDELVSLRSARFRLLTYYIPDSEDSFPWNQLTHLYLISSTWNHHNLLSVLSQCVNLTHLQFHEGLCRKARQDPEPVTLPHLISMDLYDTNAVDKANLKSLCRFLPYIVTPRLRSVKYGLLNMTDDRILSNLFERSACKLTTLDICHVGGEDWDLFQGQPQLESLTIRDYTMTDDEDIEFSEYDRPNCDCLLWKMLVIESSPSEAVLPQLKHLALYGLEFDPALLVRMVESRKASVMAIQSLVIHLSAQFIVQEAQTRFYKTVLEERLCRVAGLDFHVKAVRFSCHPLPVRNR